MSRLLGRTLLAISLAILGFGAALALATEFVYPGTSDLDRGLARLSFAVGGAFAGFSVGTLMGFLLKPPQVLRIALIGLLLGGIAFGFLAWRAAKHRAERAARDRAADAIAKLTPPPLPGPGICTHE